LFARQKIPLFRDGTFVGARSHTTIEALYVRGLITLERNKKGYVVSAHQCRIVNQTPSEPPPPSSSSALQATRYSFEDPQVEGRPWDLRRLNGCRGGLNYAPAELQTVFLQVVFDCLI